MYFFDDRYGISSNSVSNISNKQDIKYKFLFTFQTCTEAVCYLASDWLKKRLPVWAGCYGYGLKKEKEIRSCELHRLIYQ